MEGAAADNGGRVLAVVSASLGAAALALSLTMFGAPLGVAAVVTGFLALRRPESRKALAILGIVLGVLSIVVLLIAIAGFVVYMTGHGQSGHP